MVGRLTLPSAPEALPEAKRGLDSPDSGLAPSPGPSPSPSPAGSSWLLPGEERAEKRSPRAQQARLSPCKDSSSSQSPPLTGCPARLCPLSFGEGVAFDPLPPKDIRYTSSVTYDSHRHFINHVSMPVGLGVSSCSQTVFCVPESTWRSYKAEVHFEPRNKPRNFASTTIIYPKHAETVYTTTLEYDCRKHSQKFLTSVELESAGSDLSVDEC